MYQDHSLGTWGVDDGDDDYEYDICLPGFILATLGNKTVVSKKCTFVDP